MFSPKVGLDSEKQNLPNAPRGTEQRKILNPDIDVTTTLKGDPKVGTVFHLGQIHSRFESVPNGLATGIISVQTDILRILQKEKPKYVAVEAGDLNVTPEDPNRGGLIRGSLFKEIFGESLPPADKLNDLQKKVLYRYGAAAVYAYYNADVTVVRTTSPEEMKDEDLITNDDERNAKREATAMKVFTDEFFKAHPGEKLFLVYGGGHTFGPEDLRKGLTAAEAPVILKQTFPSGFEKKIKDFVAAKDDAGRTKVLDTIPNIPLEAWLKLPLEHKQMSLGKVYSEALTEEAVDQIMRKQLATSPEGIKALDRFRAAHDGPFSEFYPRRDGPGVSWDELSKITEMPKLTLIAITEWHAPTQEQIIRLAQPATYSAKMVGNLMTDTAKMLSLGKLVIRAESWDGKAKNLYDFLSQYAAGNPQYKAELDRRYAAKTEVPFKGLKY